MFTCHLCVFLVRSLDLVPILNHVHCFVYLSVSAYHWRLLLCVHVCTCAYMHTCPLLVIDNQAYGLQWDGLICIYRNNQANKYIHLKYFS